MIGFAGCPVDVSPYHLSIKKNSLYITLEKVDHECVMHDRFQIFDLGPTRLWCEYV